MSTFLLKHVPVRMCRPSLPDPRDRTAPDYVLYRDTVLLPDIQARGIQEPLAAYQDGEAFHIFSGVTRLECARLLGLEAVPACVWAEKPQDLGLAAWLANENRRDWTNAERSRFYVTTMKEQGLTLSQFCRKYGLKLPTVYRRVAWLQLVPEDLWGKVGEGDGLIPERCAYALKNYPEEERRAKCELVMKGMLTAEAMEGKGKKRKPKQDKIEVEGVMVAYPAGMANALLAEVLKRVSAKLK